MFINLCLAPVPFMLDCGGFTIYCLIRLTVCQVLSCNRKDKTGYSFCYHRILSDAGLASLYFQINKGNGTHAIANALLAAVLVTLQNK